MGNWFQHSYRKYGRNEAQNRVWARTVAYEKNAINIFISIKLIKNTE